MKRLNYTSLLLSLFFILSSAYPQSNGARFDALEKELDNVSYLNNHKSRELLSEMYLLSEQDNSHDYLLARTFYSESILNVRQGMNDTLLNKKIDARLEQDIDLYEKTLLQLASNYGVSAKGDFAEAFNLALSVLENAKTLNDSILVARTLNTMGVICRNVNLPSMAKDYYEEALKWVEHSFEHRLYPTILINLYSLQLNHKESDNISIGDSINALIDTLKQREDKGLLSIIYINTSGYWSRTGEEERALTYLLEAKSMHEDNPHRQANISHNLGLYHLHDLKDYDKALLYFNESKLYWQERRHYRALTQLYRNLSELYEAMNIPDSALYYQRESSNLLELTNNNIQLLDTHRKYILSSVEGLENKLALAQTEIELRNRYFLIVIISAVAIVLIILFLLIILLQKRKSIRQQVFLKEAEAKELKARLEKEQSIQKEKMESKLREITSYSLLLSHKNQVLNQILEVSETLSSQNESEVKKEIAHIVQDNIRIDNDWSDFMIHFDKVHPRFFEKAKELYPNVSENDLLLIAYIRIGLPTKQIAQMMNVNPESIRTSRSRLKKKMGIEKDDNLYDIIRNI